jgi:hypothetical protein
MPSGQLSKLLEGNDWVTGYGQGGRVFVDRLRAGSKNGLYRAS